jgi:hypothetical protein
MHKIDHAVNIAPLAAAAPVRRAGLAMLRIFAVVTPVFLAACDDSGCISDCISIGGGPTVKGSGVLKSEMRPVENFNAIRATVGRVTVERTGVESLTLTAEDNLLALFTSHVKDGTLYLSVAKGKSLSGKLPVYRITVADLRRLDLAGSGSIDASKLAGETLSMTVSGSGDLKAAGQVVDLTVAVSGSGTADASNLIAKRAKAVVSGSGDLTVNASDELDATVSGSGSIRYVGSPKLSSHISGSGSIEKK